MVRTVKPPEVIVKPARADSIDADVRSLLVLMPRIVGRAKRRTLPSQLADYDLTPRHLALFAMLLDGPLTVNELAAALNLAPTTVSLMVGALADQRLLDRTEDPGDRRRKLIAIAPATRPAIDAWLGDSATAWRHALAPLTPEDRALVVRTLQAYEDGLFDQA
ncbi:MarR family winged helix-turn-helix transcriptional regulator [Agromyces albus]|uniref:MarR family winged helix-turn-helix transcriptional regulator n=1 Tax=Agromyces albus TaxID=205332 RepID=UPI00278A770F|nr:MarR family transcriptional regulator [Agromyces albus]MDQ0576671.1 DNA-binding MarR family transcriptional regulator [Agromyces albus]